MHYTSRMKKHIFVVLCFLFSVSVFSEINASVAMLRDTMYNDALNHEKVLLQYEKTVAELEKTLTGYDLYVELSRCEYYVGRSYFYGEKNDLAGERYDKGLAYAQKALDIKKGEEALLMYAENLSQNCAVKPTSYAIAHGLSIGGYAKDVLKINENNAAASYLLSAQHIYAPAPFHNHRKGIREMKEILEMPEVVIEKDDEFNLTSAIAYGYIEREEYEEALPWIEKALAVYPGNFFALDLKQEILEKR